MTEELLPDDYEDVVDLTPEIDSPAADPIPVVPGQETLFGGDGDFHKHWDQWKGMPEFVGDAIAEHSSILVHFLTAEDREAFIKLVDQPITPLTRAIYYPRQDWDRVADLRWFDVNKPLDTERRKQGQTGALYGKKGESK